MAKSIKLGSDTYLDSSGITVDSSGTKLSQCRWYFDQLLNQLAVPTTATSYSCNWSEYDFLVIVLVHYNNVLNTIVVPVTYFAETGSGSRPELYNPQGGASYDVYKNSNSTVYLKASATAANYGVRIYGVSFGIKKA